MVDVRAELWQARAELIRLIREREELEKTIAKQKRKVAAWAELCNESEYADQELDLGLRSLTDACMTVLRSARKEWMTIAEVQADLKEIGFPLSDYKAATASITTTVTRMVQEGSVVSHKLAGGVAEYKWVGPREYRGALVPILKLAAEHATKRQK